jgi:hypothetical protein
MQTFITVEKLIFRIRKAASLQAASWWLAIGQISPALQATKLGIAGDAV